MNNIPTQKEKIALPGSIAYYESAMGRLREYKEINRASFYNHDPTSNIFGILMKALHARDHLDRIELKELDISAQNLMGLHSLPDFVKFTSGINWNQCKRSKLAWDLFMQWYKSQPSTGTTQNLLESPMFESKMAPKVERVRRYEIDKLRMSRGESPMDTEQSSSDEDNFQDSVEYQNLCKQYKKEFKAFTKPQLSEQHFTFDFAAHEFCRMQLSLIEDAKQLPQYVYDDIKYQLKKSFEKRKRAAIAKREKQIAANLKANKLMLDTLKNDTQLLVKPEGENDRQHQFKLVNESQKFQTWCKDAVIRDILNTEQDYNSSHSDIQNAKSMLMEDVDRAVSHFVKQDPLPLIANIFNEDLEIDTPPVLKLKDNLIPAFASKREGETANFSH